MANTPQAKKRIRRNARRAEINGSRVSRIRTLVKKVESALETGDKASAQVALAAAQPELARGVARGGGVDALDASVGVRAAHEGGVGRAGQLHVVDVGALAGDEARILAPVDALSEELGLGGHG